MSIIQHPPNHGVLNNAQYCRPFDGKASAPLDYHVVNEML